MTHFLDDPANWPIKIPIIAHDVGRTNDRSTAVVGGFCPSVPGVIGVKEIVELPQNCYGSALANELAAVDQRYYRDAVIAADLSNDASYAEPLYDSFGRRVIGVQIGRSGDGATFERRIVRNAAIPVYHVGRTFLLDRLLNELRSNRIRFTDGPMARRAYEQLNALEVEMKDDRIVYKCVSGHDDLAMSLAMLVFAARHPDSLWWVRPIERQHRPRPKPKEISPLAWT
jgi:hypothetical protein